MTCTITADDLDSVAESPISEQVISILLKSVVTLLVNDRSDVKGSIVLVIDILSINILLITSGEILWLLDEINRPLVAACSDPLAGGGTVTVQFRKFLFVSHVAVNSTPGHTDTTPDGDSINLHSV